MDFRQYFKSPFSFFRRRYLNCQFESSLIYQHLYENNSKNTRFIPVVFDSVNRQFIPTPLKAATIYCVSTEEGYDQLYRWLTNQPEVEKTVLGTIRKLPPKDIPLDFLEKTPLPVIEISLDRLPVTDEHLFGREKELNILDEAWENPQIILTLWWLEAV